MSGKEEDPRWRTPPRAAVDIAHVSFAVPELETSFVSLKRQRVSGSEGDVTRDQSPDIPAEAFKLTNGVAGAALMKEHFASVGKTRPGYDCAMEARLRVIGSMASIGNPGRVVVGIQESRMRVMSGLMMRARHGEAFGEEAIMGASQTFIPRVQDGRLRGARETAADELRMATLKRFGPIEALYHNAVKDSKGASRCIMNMQTRRLMHNLLHMAEYGLSVDAARSLRKVISDGGDAKGALADQLSKDAAESVGTFNEVRVNKDTDKKVKVSAYAGSALSVASIRRGHEEGVKLLEDAGAGASSGGIDPSMFDGDPPSLVDQPFSSDGLGLPETQNGGDGDATGGQRRFRFHLEQDRRAIIRLRQMSAPQSIPVPGGINVPEIETITRGYVHTYLRAPIPELGERGCHNGDGTETGIPCVFAQRGDRYMIECGYTAAVKMADIEEACAHHVSAKNTKGASRFGCPVSTDAAEAAINASNAAGDAVLSQTEAGSAMDQIGRIAGAASTRGAPVSYKPKSERASNGKKKKKKGASDGPYLTVQELMGSGAAKTRASAIQMIVAESAPVSTRAAESPPDSVYRGTASLFDLEGASFVCREFLTPIQALAYKDDKRTPTAGLCIGCIRRMCATLAMVCRDTGHRPDAPLQNHANIVGGVEGYPPCMMIDFGGGSGSGDPGADILEPEFMRRPMVGWWPDTYKTRTVVVKITKTLADGSTKAMDVHVVGREEQILHFSEGPRAGVVLDYGSPFSRSARRIEVIGCPAVAPMFPSRHDCGDEPVAVETKEGQYEFRYLSAKDLSRRLSGKPLLLTRPGGDPAVSRGRTRISELVSRTASAAASGPAFGRKSRLFDSMSRARNPKRPMQDTDDTYASTEDAKSEVIDAVQWVVMADEDYALFAPRSVERRQSADDAHYSATSIVGIKMTDPMEHLSNTTPNAPTHPWAAAAASGRGYSPPNSSVDDEDRSMDMNDYTEFTRDEARPTIPPPVAHRRRDFSRGTGVDDPDRPFAGPGGFMPRESHPEMARAPPPVASDAGECLETFVARGVPGEVSCDDAHDRYVNNPNQADKSSSDPLNVRFSRIQRERPPPPRSPRLSIGPFFEKVIRHKWLCVFSRCLYRTRVHEALDIVGPYARTMASRTTLFRKGMPVYGAPAKVIRAALRIPERYGVLWRVMARIHLSEMLSVGLARDEVEATVYLFLAGNEQIKGVLSGDPRSMDSMWRVHSEKRCASAAAAHFSETHAPLMEAMRTVGFYTDKAITDVKMPLLAELHGDPKGIDEGVPTDCILSSFYPHDGHVAVPGDMPDISQVSPSVQMSQPGGIEPVESDARLSMIQTNNVKCTWTASNADSGSGRGKKMSSAAKGTRPRLRDGLDVKPQSRTAKNGRVRYATMNSKTSLLSKRDRGAERLRSESVGDSRLYLALSALMRRLPPHNYKTQRLVRMIVDYMDTFQSIAMLSRWVLLLSLKRGYGHADPTHRRGFHERSRIIWMFRMVSMSHLDITDFAIAHPERFACAWREYAVYLNDCGSDTRRGALMTITDHATICGSVRSAADMTGVFLTTWMEDALCATVGKPQPDDDESPKWIDNTDTVERFIGDNGALREIVGVSHEATEIMIRDAYSRVEGHSLNFDGRSPLFVLREDAIAVYREYVSRNATQNSPEIPQTQTPEILLASRMGIEEVSHAIRLATRMLRVVGKGEGGRVLPRFDVLGVLGASRETVEAVTMGMAHFAFYSTPHTYVKELAESIVKKDPFDLARIVVFCNIACVVGQDTVMRITSAGQARLQVATARSKFAFHEDVDPGVISVPFCMDCREVRGALYSPTMNMKPVPGIAKTVGSHNTTTHLNETYPEDMEDDSASEMVPFTSCSGKRRTHPKMNQSRWYGQEKVGSVNHSIDADNTDTCGQGPTSRFKKSPVDVVHNLGNNGTVPPPPSEMDVFLEYMTSDETYTTGGCTFLPIQRSVVIGAVAALAGTFYSACPNCLIVHPVNGRMCSRESITCSLHSMSSDTLLAAKSEQVVVPYDAKRARMATLYGKWTGCSVCTRTLCSRLSITNTLLVADTLSCSMTRDTVTSGGTKSYRDSNREYRRSPIVQDGSFDISRETICSRDAKSLLDMTVQPKSNFVRRAMANSERSMRKYGPVE